MIWPVMGVRYRLQMLGVSLIAGLAIGQVDQQTPAKPAAAPPGATEQSSAGQQSTPQASTQPANQKPGMPQTVAGAAHASKSAKESSPPLKVYRNRDVMDPTQPDTPKADALKAAAAPSMRVPAKSPGAVSMQNEAAFEMQGNAYKRQVLGQKGKIAGIANQVRDLSCQYTAWSEDHSRRTNPEACWTSEGENPAFKGWCDVGKNLKAALGASQRQLAQEKARLEQMQEDIRRKGYGNAVYDPD